jgi:hypothetical protein
MKNSTPMHSQDAPESGAQSEKGLTLWQRMKNSRLSYLTLPLLVMATVVEFVILATGFKYQQAVCLPTGMGVTFFGIGPIGATILAVELLKLPLAVWTASRTGWAKGFMLVFGLPLICVLTFQLVKDMAVYEMGTAMTPAAQFLEKAATEEIKIKQLNGELAAIEGKKMDRERKQSELAAKNAKAKAEIEEALKRNEESRLDAISLTDFQKKELGEVESRQANITAQFDADAAQLTKSISDLRARRETEVGRATKWNAEEARIENDYKEKLAAYTNLKNAYEKDKAEYDNANFLKRSLMREPVDPGVPPVKESNTVLKPTLLAEIDGQIKAKEAELLAVNNKRRERVAAVDDNAHRVREEFDKRSRTKREETDRKRDELLAAQAALVTAFAAESKQIDQDFEAVAKTIDGIRADIDASRKKAESYYEAREAAIRNTQVHRIATTVEIARGLLMGERPMSITATAKERGDILTDQISMVRIWVYPVLAFIVAFLPTLMVEIGVSTLFKPEQKRPAYRMGFMGRRMHDLYKRAGRVKILRAERLAGEASKEIAVRDEALVIAKAEAEQALAAKEVELQSAHDAMGVAAMEHAEQLKKKEDEWVAKFASLADSLNQAVTEKDALRDFQKAEIERQVQLRQNSWSDRITQLRQELDAERANNEAERTAMLQEHHKKMLEVSEDAKTQVAQARRQVAQAEMTAEEKNVRLEYELKEAVSARDTAVMEMQQQAESLTRKVALVKEEAAREIEKAARQEKHRMERQQLEFSKTLRQREDEFEHQLKQREQELALQSDARLLQEEAKVEQAVRRREEELERQFDDRIRETDARWKQELQQREDASQTRLKQREQQLQAHAESRVSQAQSQAEQQLRRVEAELERQIETQSREAVTKLEQELQQKELTFQARLKLREQELASKAAARETELQNQSTANLRARDEEWERQAELRVQAVEARLLYEVQQKEELFQAQSRQREQQWQAKLDAVRAEAQAQSEQAVRRRDAEAETGLRELEVQLRKEMQQREEAVQADARQREQSIVAQLTAQAEARQSAAEELWRKDSEEKIRVAVSPIKALLTRTERERDEAKESTLEAMSQVRHLEEKLDEASSFLNGWKNGKNGKHILVSGGR